MARAGAQAHRPRRFRERGDGLVSGNRIVWWWELRFIVALALWFLLFNHLWDVGKSLLSGRTPGLAAVGNAVLLLVLALLASWKLPLYPSR